MKDPAEAGENLAATRAMGGFQGEVRSANQATTQLTPSHERHVPLALTRGTGTELIGEVAALLRRRLRLAALLLSIAFAVLLVRHAFHVDPKDSASVWLFWLHVLVAVVLAALAAVLYWRWEVPLWRLRLCELVVFGLPAVFFLVVQYSLAVAWSDKGGFELETVV